MSDKLFFLPKKFIALNRDLLKSEAFLGLSGTSIKIFLLLYSRARNTPCNPGNKSRKRRYYIENNGEIMLTYNEIMERLGVSAPTISTSIKKLVARGLIEITRPGNGKCRVATLYGLSNRWELYGKPGFEVQTVHRNVSLAGVEALHRLHANRGAKKSSFPK